MKTLLIIDDNVELASLLAVVAEVQGFVPKIAHTGREALAAVEERLPDAALVDLLLPDVSGQELLRKLTDRGIVTFAMSGVFRGEHFARAAVEEHGARAFFEKPFAARDALIKLVALLEQPGGGPADAQVPRPPPLPTRSPPPTPPADVDLDLGAAAAASALDDDAPTKPGVRVPGFAPDGIEAAPADEAQAPAGTPLLDALESSTAQTTGIFATNSAEPPPPSPLPSPEPERPLEEPGAPEASAPAEPAPADDGPLEAAPPGRPSSPAPAEPDVAVPLPFSGRDVWGAAPLPIPGSLVEEAGGPTVLGEPGALARLLARLARRKADGEVRAKVGEVVKVVGVSFGRVVFAASNLGGERLFRFAQKAGKVPPERTAELQMTIRQGQKTGDALVSLGLVTAQERADLTRQLVCEIVWSLLDPGGGEAQVVARAPARKGLIPLSLEIPPLVLEGYRRGFTLLRLRGLIEADKRYQQAHELPWPAEEVGLTEGERALWSNADGSKSVEDLILLSELGEREALAALVGLHHLGMLEARAPASRRIVIG